METGNRLWKRITIYGNGMLPVRHGMLPVRHGMLPVRHGMLPSLVII